MLSQVCAIGNVRSPAVSSLWSATLSARAQQSRDLCQWGICGGSARVHVFVINLVAVIKPKSQNLVCVLFVLVRLHRLRIHTSHVSATSMPVLRVSVSATVCQYVCSSGHDHNICKRSACKWRHLGHTDSATLKYWWVLLGVRYALCMI